MAKKASFGDFIASKSGGKNENANPFIKRVKKAAGGIIKGGTGAGAPNGNSWKHNDSPKKPFGATNNRMKKGGKVC